MSMPDVIWVWDSDVPNPPYGTWNVKSDTPFHEPYYSRAAVERMLLIAYAEGWQTHVDGERPDGFKAAARALRALEERKG